MRITIRIQNVLLDRLTQARTDDGVVDFNECIDLSDQGCMDAVIALQQLYQRKLNMSMPKKPETIKEEQEEPERPAAVKRVQTAPPVPAQAKKAQESSPRNSKTLDEEEEPSATSARSERKHSKGLRGIFHSDPGDTGREKQERKPAPTYHRMFSAPPDIPKAPRRTTKSSLEDATLSKRVSKSSVSSQNSSKSNKSQLQEWRPDPPFWTQGMSRASTLAPIASTEPMAKPTSNEPPKYGGSCKYAFLIRENGPKGYLEAQNNAMWGENWSLLCRSSKCKFGKKARPGKLRDEVDDRVYESHGLKYRWLFLAKSHCAHNMLSMEWPYICLICHSLNQDSQQYSGHDDLFAHIAEHQQDKVGEVPLRGPISFTNRGIKEDDHFDLCLPERQKAVTRQALNDPEDLRRKLEEVGLDRNSKTSSVFTQESSVSAHTNPDWNPWAENNEVRS